MHDLGSFAGDWAPTINTFLLVVVAPLLGVMVRRLGAIKRSQRELEQKHEAIQITNREGQRAIVSAIDRQTQTLTTQAIDRQTDAVDRQTERTSEATDRLADAVDKLPDER